MSKKKKKASATKKTGNTAWKKEIKQEQNYICPVCGKVGTDQSMNIHHCLPKSKKGKSTKENCCGVHIECHKWIHKVFGNRFYDPR